MRYTDFVNIRKWNYFHYIIGNYMLIKKLIFFVLITVCLSSCACLKKNTDNNRILLTESNLTLLDGKYERKSLPQGEDSLFGDLYWTLFGDLYSYFFSTFSNREMISLENDTFFLELKVINKNKI